MTELLLVRALFRSGLLLLAVVAFVLLGLELRGVVIQVFAAAIVAAGIAPIVSRLSSPERTRSWPWRPSSALVVVVLYLALGMLVVVIGVVLLQAVLTQGGLLLERAPTYALTVQAWYDELAERWQLLDQLDVYELVGGTSRLTQWAVDFLGQVLNVAGLLLAAFGGALNVIFVLFMALYMTVDGPSMRDYMLDFLPASHRPRARRIVSHISARLGRWVVGEIVLCAIIGTGAGIALWLLGVPGAALLGVVWAVAELIPGIGPFVSAVPTILLGFLAGPTTGILAAIFALVWSQFENNVVVPRVMGRAVKLNPLVVLVALLVGNHLLGLAGALFAIPAVAVLAVVVDELHQERRLAEEEAKLELEVTCAVR